LRTGGWECTPVVVGKRDDRVPIASGRLLQRLDRIDAALVMQQSQPVGGDNQPSGDPVAGEDVEQPNAIRSARRAGEREDDGVLAQRPLRLGVGERTGCLGAGEGGGKVGKGGKVRAG